MNIILFTDLELVTGLVGTDSRVCHVRDVLQVADGERFDAGIVNGLRGKALYVVGVDDRVQIQFTGTDSPSPLYPVDVMVGMSRPQSCRFVLRSLATMGVRSIEFVLTEKGERSYASSQLWTSGEYLEIVTQAVAQSFETNVPTARFDRTLKEALQGIDVTTADEAGKRPAVCPNVRICLDNYESTMSLAAAISAAELAGAEESAELASDDSYSTCLLIGSERGWSDQERCFIREHGFVLASMGSRVLRVETASVAAVSTLLANRYWIRESGTPSTRA